jgi:hypothetical protein
LTTLLERADEPQDAHVRVAAATARDPGSGETRSCENGAVRVPVDARSARIVLLEETR